MPAFLSATTINTKSDHIASAVRLATNTLESYRVVSSNSTTATSLPSSGVVSSTVTDNNIPYNIKSTFCPSDKPSSMSCSATARYIRVEVFDNGSEIYQAESYFTQLR